MARRPCRIFDSPCGCRGSGRADCGVNSTVKPATWLVQRKIAESTLHALATACEEHGKPLELIDVVPFSPDLPAMPDVDGPCVIYGYTSLILNCWGHERWRSGVFFDPETFTPSAYHRHYGSAMLNDDARFDTTAGLAGQPHDPDDRFFIRPNDDFKRLVGRVVTFREFQDWYALLEPNGDITPSTEILYCRPKEIPAEWRLFVVDGQVVTGSQYKPRPSAHVPSPVVEMASRAAAAWSPVPIYVMDLGVTPSQEDEHEHRYGIVELNCFNGSGLYQADVSALVSSVSRSVEMRWE